MATVDHLISRYDPRRWLHTATNEQRKVLACFECNQRRQAEETANLCPEERLARSKGGGATFKPTPNTPIPVKSLQELKNLFSEQGIDLDIKSGQPIIIGLHLNKC